MPGRSTATVGGRPLDTAPGVLAPLRSSADLLDADPPGTPEDVAAALRDRIAEDGYLYLPGFFDRDAVLAARHDLMTRLAAIEALAPGTDPDDAIPGPAASGRMHSEIAAASEPLMELLYAGRLPALYELIFGEAVRHLDFTWLRAYPPGRGTNAHMDSVFMNRGTLDLMTAWVPLGDVDEILGGVAVLENSHRLTDITSSYAQLDVDTYCSNHSGDRELAESGGGWSGAYTEDAPALRERVGARWLTADYRAGDLLTFPIYTMHVGMDNRSDRLRLSCDLRYQPASQPADPRWVGVEPSAHGALSKLGRIC